jgi:hypothetical protein
MTTELSLDTNLIMEYWQNRANVEVIEELLRLSDEGQIDLAVTSRIREDIPRSPLSDRMNQLHEIGIQETGSVTRLGHWVLGRDRLGDDAFVSFTQRMEAIFERRSQPPPDWRDWDHLHAHHLQQRDVFLTWDRAILSIAEDLRVEFGMVVLAPEEYLASRDKL